jgi:hypothetical protein
MPTSNYAGFELKQDSDMSPPMTIKDAISLGIGNTKLTGNGSFGYAAARIGIAHISHRLFRKLRAHIKNAGLSLTSALSNHIIGIDLPVSFKQMVRANAIANVAGVTKKESVKLSVGQSPSYMVRKNHAPTNTSNAIPPFVAIARPQPAAFSFVDAFPESLRKPYPRASQFFGRLIAIPPAVDRRSASGIAPIDSKRVLAVSASKLNFFRRNGRVSLHVEASRLGFGVPRVWAYQRRRPICFTG